MVNMKLWMTVDGTNTNTISKVVQRTHTVQLNSPYRGITYYTDNKYFRLLVFLVQRKTLCTILNFPSLPNTRLCSACRTRKKNERITTNNECSRNELFQTMIMTYYFGII